MDIIRRWMRRARAFFYADNYVYQTTIYGDEIIIARCFYPAHAKIIYKDCQERWPDKQFRLELSYMNN